MSFVPSLATATISSRVMRLIVISILPAFLFLGTLSVLLAKQKVESSEITLEMNSAAISAAIDQKISSVISALHVILVTERHELSGQNLQRLHERLKSVVAGQPEWISIGFILPSGNQRLNTIKPYGEALPSLAHLPFFQQALSTGRPAVSGFRIGIITQEPLISVAIPISRRGKIQGVVLGSLDPTALANILEDQVRREGWTAALVDDQGKVIARSRDSKKYQGRDATPLVMKKVLSNEEGIFESNNFDGLATMGAIKRSRLTNWSVLLGMPAAESQAIFYYTLWLVLLAGIVFLGLGFALAYYFSRKISEPIHELARNAKALGEGREFKAPITQMSEIQEVSDALTEAAERSKNAIEMRETFLSIASHELRTPLTALLLTLRLMQREADQKDTSKVTYRSEKAIQQAQRISELIDELLDVSRLSSGKLSLTKKQVRLDELVVEVLSQLDMKEVKLELEEVKTILDPSRIEQVIINLLTNAQKYGDEMSLIVKVWSDEDHAYVAISDKGPGISEEDQLRIFNKFDQGTPDKPVQGLGLGLWISKQIALGHGGDLTVQSSVGEGACFTLSLPKGILV